ncbi:sperm acrosome membrane-associated protein 4-like [Boleophthalmus pectinirostris]|uniref:sperm acrosome membrane-associated protein 4-like n=1 Tax=Boleophthalmus pectinirostris TaxID=150288 RepID=UPI000A1C67FF|nr:sperm acrosome membrane-associated protein 4-like [Boleophthalmus pectinirostris]
MSVCKTLIVLSAFMAAAYGLTCRECYIGIFSTCILGTNTDCNNGTSSCYRGDAQFNATGALKLHNRGCIDTDLCGKTLTGSLLGAAYTSTFNCCSTDMCNSASSLHLSVAIGTVLTLLSTLWVSQ